jgi:20S proteasome alpha/beta subunit
MLPLIDRVKITHFQPKMLARYPALPPRWPSTERKARMTILAGIICSDAIIVAADSLMIDAATGAKSYVDKISIADFSGDHVLIAQAGLGAVTNRAIEKIQEKAHATPITSAKFVYQIVEDSIRETKVGMDEDQKSYIKQWGASLIVAFYENGNPHLSTFDFVGTGIANAAESHYATAGFGSTLANYLLAEYSGPKSLIGIGLATAVFIIKKVKDNNGYCGGDTNIKWLTPLQMNLGEGPKIFGRVNHPIKHLINLMEKRLNKVDEKSKTARNKQVLTAFQHIATKGFQEQRRQIEEMRQHENKAEKS